jgi:hypothetical protein
MPPEDLLTLAGNCMAMAARFAPVRENPKTKALERNPDHNVVLNNNQNATASATPRYETSHPQW